ncbi:hypothetical protein H4582DRAFT_26534 [Lactarius indigo]|nr:hypothetical protein H4582DRAFT_26534 [Lactarius indigo]
MIFCRVADTLYVAPRIKLFGSKCSQVTTSKTSTMWRAIFLSTQLDSPFPRNQSFWQKDQNPSALGRCKVQAYLHKVDAPDPIHDTLDPFGLYSFLRKIRNKNLRGCCLFRHRPSFSPPSFLCLLSPGRSRCTRAGAPAYSKRQSTSHSPLRTCLRCMATTTAGITTAYQLASRTYDSHAAPLVPPCSVIDVSHGKVGGSGE